MSVNRKRLSEDLWQIAETDYPVQGTPEEQLDFLVGYAVLAPSRYNRQPWSFTRQGAVIELRLDQTRLLPITDSRGRESIMNCGTALYYLRVAMRYFGHSPLVDVLPEAMNPHLLAHIRRGGPCPPPESVQAQFHAIRHRRTYERRFQPDPVPYELCDSLRRVASQENASLVFLEEHDQRLAVADMVVEGERFLRQNPDYRHEASADSEQTESLSSLFSELWETFAPHQIDPDLVLQAPALAVLGTPDDTPYDWLAAGQALGAILLTADAASVQASFLNQPVEVLGIRPRLRQLVAGVNPQLIVRFGFVGKDYLPHTPRRSIAGVGHIQNRLTQPHEGSP